MSVRALRDSHRPPERNPAPPGVGPQSVRAIPVQLTPIPWGKPDRKLAQMVCQSIVEATPAIVIPFNPFADEKVRRQLRSHHVSHI